MPFLPGFKMDPHGLLALLRYASYRMLLRDIRVIGGGMAFFFLLSVFPLFTVIGSIYGLVKDGQHLPNLYALLSDVLPVSQTAFLQTQLKDLADAKQVHLSFGLIVSLLISFYSALSAAKVLIEGVGIVTGVSTAKGIFRYQLVSALVTLILIGLIVMFSAIYLFASNVMLELHLIKEIPFLWAALALLVKYLSIVSLLWFIYLLILPHGKKGFNGHLLGAMMAGVLWMAATNAFQLFLDLANLGSLYGAISALVSLLLWIYIITYVVLFGAVISDRCGKNNDELPQTASHFSAG